MAAPYSIDLREKVLTKYESGDYTQEEIANLFSIGISSVKRWLKKKRETGDIGVSKGKRGRIAKIDELGLKTIAELVEDNNSITLEELSELYLCTRQNYRHTNPIS